MIPYMEVENAINWYRVLANKRWCTNPILHFLVKSYKDELLKCDYFQISCYAIY